MHNMQDRRGRQGEKLPKAKLSKRPIDSRVFNFGFLIFNLAFLISFLPFPLPWQRRSDPRASFALKLTGFSPATSLRFVPATTAALVISAPGAGLAIR